MLRTAPRCFPSRPAFHRRLLAPLWIACALSLCAAHGRADSDELTSGVFLCHHDPGIGYSVPPEGWCQHYLDELAIVSCDGQNPQILEGGETVWFLLSAFLEEKTWCGTEFGFGDYPAELYAFESWGPCAPGEVLELPTDGWPGPREGTGFISVDLPWSGNFLPVYYFTGYAYAEQSGRIPIDIDPATGFAGWGNCLVPPETFGATCLPSLGLMMDGHACCPESLRAACCLGEECFVLTEEACADLGGVLRPEHGDCGPPNPCVFERHACCLGAQCELVTEDECAALGGEWHPEWDACDPNPCDTELHACCVGPECYVTLMQQCSDLGGEWHPEWDGCWPNPCPLSLHACCLDLICELVTQEDCQALGGEWHPEWESCDPNPCTGPHRVCCLNGSCIVTTEQHCTDLGGDWYPDWDSCSPNPCPEPLRACCLGEACHLLTEQECHDIFGVWHPEWSACYPNPCLYERHVCCIGESCMILNEQECLVGGGVWHPDWDDCDPNPCLLDTVTNLTGGVFLCHHDPSIAYSVPEDDWCAVYREYALESCAEQNPSIMTTEERVWFVLSAFTSEKQWCGAEFGFGDYAADLFHFTGWGACAPGEYLELPSEQWPGPGEGTAMVTVEQPWRGQIEPVYYFTGYIDQGAPGQIPLDVDPLTGFAGWGNCLSPPQTYATGCHPALGLMMEGSECYPEAPRYACCLGEECHLLTPDECQEIGGVLHTEATDCGPPNPCLPPELVCCVGEECRILTQAECEDLGGVFHPEYEDCGPPNPCSPPHYGVCCVGEDCYVAT
ncbi:MAG: hypothetical protein GF330_07630, partial [Candidatus Eisenbacteria bacterium]|nr:hypothetical protein [Candidatus Eisenbacteria bacterium]